ncbi:cobalamin biosynthesis protein CobD/CbiB [Xanthomonas arboricola]|nr:cobalamin biosynthesis protein CobD/CbiB [Xanthomonas cannabis]
MRLLLSDADARALAERLGTDMATLHADLCRQSRRKPRSIFIICLVVVLVIATLGLLIGSVIDLSTVSNFLSELFHVWSTSSSTSHFAHHLGTGLVSVADYSTGSSR